jgi:hypothetical protein
MELFAFPNGDFVERSGDDGTAAIAGGSRVER